MAKTTSVCSCGRPVAFYWRECVLVDHVRAAVAHLMEIVAARPGCTTNDYIDADNENAFERRLKLATRGRLKPSDHVKTIASVRSADMFEIRWTDIKAIARNAVSGLIEGDLCLHIRLYYIEEGGPWIVGLHAHEKQLADSEEQTRRLQDVEIGKAEAHARAGAERRWGVDALCASSTTGGPGHHETL